MTVIGWNRHEYLEMEKPQMYVPICKPAEAKPTDARTEILEARGSQNCLPGCIAGNTLMAVIDSDESACDTAIYLTLIGSCNMLGVEPYGYFETILS